MFDHLVLAMPRTVRCSCCDRMVKTTTWAGKHKKKMALCTPRTKRSGRKETREEECSIRQREWCRRPIETQIMVVLLDRAWSVTRVRAAFVVYINARCASSLSTKSITASTSWAWVEQEHKPRRFHSTLNSRTNWNHEILHHSSRLVGTDRRSQLSWLWIGCLQNQHQQGTSQLGPEWWNRWR